MKKWCLCIWIVLCCFACNRKTNNKVVSIQEKENIISVEDSILLSFQPNTPNNLPEQVIKRTSYLCSYNKETRCANWSAWYLLREHTDGTYKKRFAYMEDEDTIENKQRLDDWDSLTTLIYDHGHLCPAGDNKWDIDARRETFYLSNMCVQNRRLNQETWEHLESRCRMWAKKFNGLYIVAGPIYYNNSLRKTGNNLIIPDAFYKVVFCVSDSSKSIGFIYLNADPIENDKMENHVVSIDSIEKITGIDFFHQLPDSIENIIESSSDIKQWRVY